MKVENLVISREKLKSYIENDSNKCPRCGSSAIDGESIEVDSTGAWQKVTCTICSLVWTDVLKLVGIQVQGDSNISTKHDVYEYYINETGEPNDKEE